MMSVMKVGGTSKGTDLRLRGESTEVSETLLVLSFTRGLDASSGPYRAGRRVILTPSKDAHP